MVGLKGGQLEILTRDQVYSIHQATMEILERVGVKVQEPKAISILKENGANVDERSASKNP